MPLSLKLIRSLAHVRRSPEARGFTLVELLVVISIIVLLVAVLLPVFGKVRQNARTATCLINERSISHAMSSYSQDNAARLPSSRTDAGSDAVPGGTKNMWVNASGAGLVSGVETVKSLENGSLWPYMDRNPNAYRSPNDPTGRVRSYSINAYVGNTKCPDDYQCGSLVPLPDGQPLQTETISRIPQPASTLCAIVENSVAGYNKEGFLVDWSLPEWIDLPAFWDEGRVNVSFMDGSTKTLNIFSDRFISEATAIGVSYVEPSPAGAWYAMRQYLLPGRCDL